MQFRYIGSTRIIETGVCTVMRVMLCVYLTLGPPEALQNDVVQEEGLMHP